MDRRLQVLNSKLPWVKSNKNQRTKKTRTRKTRTNLNLIRTTGINSKTILTREFHNSHRISSGVRPSVSRTMRNIARRQKRIGTPSPSRSQKRVGTSMLILTFGTTMRLRFRSVRLFRMNGKIRKNFRKSLFWSSNHQYRNKISNCLSKSFKTISMQSRIELIAMWTILHS